MEYAGERAHTWKRDTISHARGLLRSCRETPDREPSRVECLRIEHFRTRSSYVDINVDRGIVEFLLLREAEMGWRYCINNTSPFCFFSLSLSLFSFFVFSINRYFSIFSPPILFVKLSFDSNEFYFIAISCGTLLGTTFKNIPASVIVVRVLIERNTMRYILSNAIAYDTKFDVSTRDCTRHTLLRD